MSPMFALAVSLLGATFTVDDNGPANFATIGDAINAAQTDDLILVEPGTYPVFSLAKRLTILGRASAAGAPRVAGNVTITSTTGFTIGGLAFQDVAISNVNGPAVLDDCTVGQWAPSQVDPGVLIDHCAQLVAARLSVTPRVECGCAAIAIHASHVALSDATLVGGKGVPGFSSGGTGGPALLIDQGSEVTVSGCPLIEGGYEGWYTGSFGSDGPSGNGITVLSSTLSIRGAPTDVVVHGDADPLFGQQFGNAIYADHSRVVVSGVTLDTNDVTLANGALLLTPPDEPYIEAIGQDPTARIVRVAGPAGALAGLIASVSPGESDVFGYEANFWFAFTTTPLVVLFSTQGQSTPVDIPATIPSGVVGVTVRLQAVFPGIAGVIEPGATFVTNPAALLVRF